ncbi:hypothetical protein GCM10009555_105640 [Acrocarpospora macrocephala]|uniref:Uncharacterized protein n=1 Tax=Acrocarpospora macrocephala TaxID=150177 RepID=A0A5M3WW16_9ACTN|nr:hypothetical protein [Acrocarpospora macrocephala]GES13635.1 hypothetical protein Amac_072320 [Acrocarpospora macrocephala]
MKEFAHVEDVLLVLGPAEELPGLLAGLVAAGFTSAYGADELLDGEGPTLAAARAALEARGGSGRADVVVSVRGRLDLAARWVRRGGRVASLAAETVMPSLDTLVAREVTVIGGWDE